MKFIGHALSHFTDGISTGKATERRRKTVLRTRLTLKWPILPIFAKMCIIVAIVFQKRFVYNLLRTTSVASRKIVTVF